MERIPHSATLAVGDIVRFSDRFCNSVQADTEVRGMRGRIVEIIKGRPNFGPDRARVEWLDDSGISGSLLSNLTRVSR